MRKWLFGLPLAVAALVVACGGGDDNSDGEEMAMSIFEAISEPGMVYHAVGGDTEVWVDVDDQVYRSRQVTADGDRIRIGEGWTVTEYDPLVNDVSTQDESVDSDQRPRIDDPAINFLEPLGALAFAQELVLLGERDSQEGETVIVLEARSPIVENGELTDRTLIGRVEVDPDTLLLSAFERREALPLEATPVDDPFGGPRRTVYTVSEMIPESDLEEGFFSPQAAEDAVLTFEDKVDQAREAGIEPHWLGEQYSSETGDLILQPDEGGFVVSIPVEGSESAPEVQFHYTTPATAPDGEPVLLGEAVIIKLWNRERAEIAPPFIEGFTSDLPENRTEVEVQGQAAALMTSALRVRDAPCPEGVECPESDAPLYHRLVVEMGETAVQIEAHAKVDPEGIDRNPYNSQQALLEIAEALTTTD